MKTYDITIVGAGIVGMATAYHLSQSCPELKVAIVEKENKPAAHQTGHNSGVIHSGIYYKPGGSKAMNCRRGYRYLLDFARQHDIPTKSAAKSSSLPATGSCPPCNAFSKPDRLMA